MTCDNTESLRIAQKIWPPADKKTAAQLDFSELTAGLLEKALF
jgi:hypothetical protein